MSGVFISYRREDSRGSAGRLYDDLRDRLGKGLVFRDIDAIEPGVDFLSEIVNTIEECDALVAVIGRGWVESKDKAGNRRLDLQEDLVRLEISSALAAGKAVIPVLVEDAVMPSATELPEPLVALASRNALPISDLRWDYDVGRLVARLHQLLQPRAAPMSESEPAPALESASLTPGARSVRSRAATALGGLIAGMILVLVLQKVVDGNGGEVANTRDTGVATSVGSDSPVTPPRTDAASTPSVKPFVGSNANITKTDGTVFAVQEETIGFGQCASQLGLRNGQSIRLDRLLSLEIQAEGSRYHVNATLITGERITDDMDCVTYVPADFHAKNSLGEIEIRLSNVARIDFRQ